jgi:hypothetical protein
MFIGEGCCTLPGVFSAFPLRDAIGIQPEL